MPIERGSDIGQFEPVGFDRARRGAAAGSPAATDVETGLGEGGGSDPGAGSKGSTGRGPGAPSSPGTSGAGVRGAGAALVARFRGATAASSAGVWALLEEFELAKDSSAPRLRPLVVGTTAAGPAFAVSALPRASCVSTSCASDAKSRAPIDSGAYSKIVLAKLGDSASLTLALMGVRKTCDGK